MCYDFIITRQYFIGPNCYEIRTHRRALFYCIRIVSFTQRRELQLPVNIQNIPLNSRHKGKIMYMFGVITERKEK